MKQSSYIKLAQMGCGKEILNSCNERGQIEAAIYNCNSAIKYAKKCFLNYKETGKDFWIEVAEVHLLPYYKELLKVEFLANKYKELWQEKFYKSKLTAEKILAK